MTANNDYVPALGYDALTRFYDPLIRWFLREATFKRTLIQQARIGAHHRVLDVGCGTGTLTLLAQQHEPGFADVAEMRTFQTIGGTLGLIRALKH